MDSQASHPTPSHAASTGDPANGLSDDIRAQIKQAGITEEAYTHRWLILGILCLSLVLVVMGNSALNVALPTLGEELNASSSQLQWLVNAYQIAFGSLLMPMGAAGDRYGRKKALNLGLTVYGITALFAMFAYYGWHIIAIRAIMGVAAALIMPATMSLLTSAFLPKDRGTAISIWVAFAGIGGVVGSIASGFILQLAPWHWIFLINVPFVGLLLLLAHYFVPTSKDPHSRPIDWFGSFIAFALSLAFLFAFTEGPVVGWFSTQIIAVNIVGFVLTIVFFLWMKKADNPLFDLNWFKDARFAMGSVVIFLQFVSAFAWFFISMQYFQIALGYSPAEAGLLTIPAAISQLFGAPFASKLSEKLGPKLAAINGLLFTSTAYFIVAFMAKPDGSIIPIIVAQFIFGVGLPWTGAPITNRMLQSLPPNRVGMGSAVNDVVRQMGSAVGVATIGSALGTSYTLWINAKVCPESIRSTVESGVSAAMRAVHAVPAGQDVQGCTLEIVNTFAQASQMSLILCGGTTIVAAILVAIFGLGDPSAPPAKDTFKPLPPKKTTK